MPKYKLDQTGAWALSVVFTAAVFTPAVYLLGSANVQDEYFGEASSTPKVAETVETKEEKPGPLSGEFGYEGQNAPKNWHRLTSENYACSTGKEQSPVNISTDDQMFTNGKLKTRYRPFRTKLQTTSNRLIASYESGLMEASESYYVQSIDFHVPSEHALNGRHFAAEIHIEHQADNGRMAQVSLFVEQGRENKEADKLLATLKTGELANINLSALLPRKQEFLQYFGSMSIPPCSEGVDRYVLTTPVSFSKKQIEILTASLRFNARELQAHRQLKTPLLNSN